MKKIILTLLVVLGFSLNSEAQISVPNTFVTGTRILASEMNANFDALEVNALNRTGGTITGNISVSPGVTIDGIDIGAMLGGSGALSAASLSISGATTFSGTLASTGNFAVNTNKFTVAASTGNTVIAGTLTTGSGSVALTTSTGKIAALTSTYVADLSNVALIGSDNTFTAKNNFLTYSETKTSPSISAGALAINQALGTHFTVSLNANATVTFSNPVSSGTAGAFTIAFTNDGTVRTLTWPASVKWPGGTTPTMSGTNGKVDFLSFITYDGGTTYYGFVSGLNY